MSWGIGEIGELGRDVCSMKVPPVSGSDDEPPYDFDGILRDHLTPGGMYREAADGGGARMENVKVCSGSLSVCLSVMCMTCSALSVQVCTHFEGCKCVFSNRKPRFILPRRFVPPVLPGATLGRCCRLRTAAGLCVIPPPPPPPPSPLRNTTHGTGDRMRRVPLAGGDEGGR